MVRIASAHHHVSEQQADTVDEARHSDSETQATLKWRDPDSKTQATLKLRHRHCKKFRKLITGSSILFPTRAIGSLSEVLARQFGGKSLFATAS
jgi:hypothetical protein